MNPSKPKIQENFIRVLAIAFLMCFSACSPYQSAVFTQKSGTQVLVKPSSQPFELTPTMIFVTATPNELSPTATPSLEHNTETVSTNPIASTDVPGKRIVFNDLDIDLDKLASLQPDDYQILYQQDQDVHILSKDGRSDMILGKGKADLQSITYDGKIIGAIGSDFATWEFFDFEKHQVQQKKVFGLNTQPGNCILQNVSPNLNWTTMLCVGEESNFLLENLSDHRVLKIIEGQTESYISSSWSPDSKWLAYFRNTAIRFPNAPGGNGTGEIILVDVSCLDSTSSCPLKKIGPFALQDEPIYGQGPLMWSPDSRYFAFPTGMMGLPILIFDTSEERFSRINVGDNQNAVNGMAWSPDGKWIACSFGIEIHLVPAQGGNTVKLVGGDREMRVIGWLSTYSKPVFQKENHLFITGAGNNIRIRQSPSLQGMVVKQLISGDRVQIIDGPVEANGYRWWKLKVEGNGTVGWAVENPDWYAMEK